MLGREQSDNDAAIADVGLPMHRAAVAPHVDRNKKLRAFLPSSLLERAMLADGDAFNAIAEVLDRLLRGAAGLATQAAMVGAGEWHCRSPLGGAGESELPHVPVVDEMNGAPCEAAAADAIEVGVLVKCLKENCLCEIGHMRLQGRDLERSLPNRQVAVNAKMASLQTKIQRGEKCR